MSPQPTSDIAKQLLLSQDFFNRSTSVLEEADSSFRPNPEMMTAAQQVAHAAQTLEWFLNGVTKLEGFDLDFAKHAADVASFTSLKAARARLEAAYKRAIDFVRSTDLARPLPPGPILGGQPAVSVIWAMVEHTAHHRGALTVYSRLLGKTPPMPYGG